MLIFHDFHDVDYILKNGTILPENLIKIHFNNINFLPYVVGTVPTYGR